MSYEVSDSVLGKEVIIGDYSKVLWSNLGDHVQLDRFNHIIVSNLGRYCYTGHNTTIKAATLGNFCSISWNVSIGGNNHDMDKITTHSFLVYPKFGLGGNRSWKSQSEPCIIGNDVWIAAGASILRGITIGDGAVIGASAVVTKDVPPYSIVAGNPARVIRKRFPDDWIKQLLKLEWWDFPEDVIRSNHDLFDTKLDQQVLDDMFRIKSEIQE